MVLGVHYPLDVIGGRINGQAGVTQRWVDKKFRDANILTARKELVAYLDNPPDAAALRVLIGKLGIAPRALLRSGEAEYAELGLAEASLDDEALIAAMAAHPILIERPIFEHGERAVIGRPPERVLELL